MKWICFLIVLMSVSGCGLIPKRVELGQDKVKVFPEAKTKEKEIQRQAADRAAKLATETVKQGLAEGVSDKVLKPASETATLTRSVSVSLGPPSSPASPQLTSDELATRLDSAVAALNLRLDEFKKENNENAGKKIEGTGFLQIPYFVYLGLFLVFGFIAFVVITIAWAALKAYSLANPPLAVGLNAVQLGGKGLANLASQLVRGGETFKNSIQDELNDPRITEQVLRIFKDSHQKEQSPENQMLIKTLIQK